MLHWNGFNLQIDIYPFIWKLQKLLIIDFLYLNYFLFCQVHYLNVYFDLEDCSEFLFSASCYICDISDKCRQIAAAALFNVLGVS